MRMPPETRHTPTASEVPATHTTPDGWGNTPLQWAMNRGHQDIAEFLLVDCNARPA